MRICPKCSKQISGESKICRDCGAILEDLPDQSLPEGNLPPGTSRQSGSPFAVEPQGGEPGCPFVVDAELVEPATAGERRAGGGAEAAGAEPPGGTGAAEGDPGARPAEPHPEASRIEDAAEHPPAQTACPGCGSSEIMRGVTVRDAGEGSGGVLQVVIVRNPDALIFKDRLFGQLKADICGQCGHVELRVTNPKQLYKHYLKSPESDPWAL